MKPCRLRGLWMFTSLGSDKSSNRTHRTLNSFKTFTVSGTASSIHGDDVSLAILQVHKKSVFCLPTTPALRATPPVPGGKMAKVKGFPSWNRTGGAKRRGGQ